MILKGLQNSSLFGSYVKQSLLHLWCYVKPSFNESDRIVQGLPNDGKWKNSIFSSTLTKAIFETVANTCICTLKPITSISMHSWLHFRWGKDPIQQPHQNMSITGTVKAIYGLHQPGRQQRSLHMTDSNTEIEAILGSCPVRHTDLMNEATKPVITGAIIMVWTLTRLGTRPGEGKHHLHADTDGARSDRGKLTSPPKDCSILVLLGSDISVPGCAT